MAGWVLSVDFGTSFTTAAVTEAGRVEQIEVDGLRGIPSGVWLDEAGVLVVGTSAERQARLAPQRWERTPKRMLGEPAPLLLGGRRVAVVDAVAAVLSHVAREAVRQQGRPPDEVRLTYPARWAGQRQAALAQAAGIAGLGAPLLAAPPRLVSEPVAAALYFAERGALPPGAQVAVYDLGGGTFDTAVLVADVKGYTVSAWGGLDGVGGESFDSLLYSHVGAVLAGRDPNVWESLQNPPDAHWRRMGEDLHREVRRAKEDLSLYPSVTLDTQALVGVPTQLTRDELESVLKPHVEATTRELAATIGRAHARPVDLAGVYLAGGSSRIPMIERVVSDLLQVPARVLGEPKSVVVLGAARWTPDVVVGEQRPQPQRPQPQRPQPQQPQQPQPQRPQPQQPQPQRPFPDPRPQPGPALDRLGVVALVFCAVFPPVAVVLGLVGNSRATRRHQSPALSRLAWIAGLVLSIPTVLVVIVALASTSK